MSNLMAILETEADKRTPQQQAAIDAHERLLYDRQMVEVGLASMCRDLKEIRDKKHYKTLGYDEFADYTQEAHGIGQRQAYKYIQIYEHLGAEVLHSSAKIGVTKLLEIATLDKDEREELFAEHTADELAAMSTDEVKRLTEQVKKLEEQISFLEEEKSNAHLPAEVVQQPFDDIEADIRAQVEEELKAEYEEKISDLEGKIMSDAELKKFRAEAEKEAKAAASDELKKLKADLKAAKDAQKAKEEAIKKAEDAKAAAEKKAKESEEKAAHAAELEARAAAAEAEKAAVEKQIKLSADPEFTRFKFLFENWEKATDALMDQLEKLDETKKGKMRAVIKNQIEERGL